MRRTVIACMLVAIVAGACSSDSTDSEESVTTSAVENSATTTTTSQADTTSSTAAATTSTTAAAATTTVAAASGLDGCVVGTWEMDSNKFFEDVFALAQPEGVDGEIEYVGGDYLLIIGGDGTFEVRRDNWAFAASSEGSEVELVINSSQSGTYELDGDMLSTRVEPGEPPEVEIKVDGVLFDLPAGRSPIAPPEAEFSGATVTCDGDALTATAADFSSLWTRAG